jgi:hypothetical protein
MSSRHRTTTRNGSRKLALIATIIASLLLKLGIDKIVELVSNGTLTTPSIYVALFSCILGLISLFVALSNAN